uniref:KIND domain-containing protein n=1 Tax=Lygus hesperus TaxID=30085 RepID=A0A0K8SDD1_LYGHE
MEEDSQQKCMLDENHCVSLRDILVSFNSPLTEEHAWALCYQCAKCFRNAMRTDRGKCRVVTDLSQVLIHRDGHVHSNTIFAGGGKSDETGDSNVGPSEQEVIQGLGITLYNALDFGLDADEERQLSPELERLIQDLTSSNEERHHNETDDEGIERDSGECDEDSHHIQGSSLALVLQLCTVHLGCGGTQEADSHYKAVCRAFVAEALEFHTFLQKVGTKQIRQHIDTPDHIDKLRLNDWARLWVQVIRELRMGVQLKKVCYTRKPIEFELTPYEILMEDIRSRRYKLNKVMVDGTIPHRVKKDAHAIILEFIRSRPPLRKAADRKLNPPLAVHSTPREKLLESIKQGHAKLSPIRRNPRREQESPVSTLEPGSELRSSKRLIKIDYSYLDTDDDDDDLEVETEEPQDVKEEAKGNPWQRTAYDLATQCPSRRASMRRHTVVVVEGGSAKGGSLSVPQSRPASRQTNTPTDDSLSCTLPEMTWSRTSLQDDLFKLKQWQEECLSLTLEEIVHIRSVLTKAELESLPVEGRVKEDAERRKVCFLCMKTRFGIFGPWGQICRLCKRTVCAKCYSKMRIPTEHFAHVPVVALSPSMLSPSESEDSFPRALVNKLMTTDRAGVGSAPTSPRCRGPLPPLRCLRVSSPTGRSRFHPPHLHTSLTTSGG